MCRKAGDYAVISNKTIRSKALDNQGLVIGDTFQIPLQTAMQS